MFKLAVGCSISDQGHVKWQLWCCICSGLPISGLPITTGRIELKFSRNITPKLKFSTSQFQLDRSFTVMFAVDLSIVGGAEFFNSKCWIQPLRIGLHSRLARQKCWIQPLCIGPCGRLARQTELIDATLGVATFGSSNSISVAPWLLVAAPR